MEQRSCSGNAKEHIDSIKCDIHNVSSLEGCTKEDLRLLSLLAIKRAGNLILHIKQEAYKKIISTLLCQLGLTTVVTYCVTLIA